MHRSGRAEVGRGRLSQVWRRPYHREDDARGTDDDQGEDGRGEYPDRPRPEEGNETITRQGDLPALGRARTPSDRRPGAG